jgi:hypothetical protein
MRALRLAKGVLTQYCFQLTFGEIPRLIYGNDAGFWNNYAARRELTILRSETSVRVGPSERATFLREEGYFPLGVVASRLVVDRVAERFRMLIADPTASQPIGPRLKDAARAIVEPLARIPEIAHLLTTEVHDLVNAYYGTPFKVNHVRAWRNVPVPQEYQKQDVYSNLWHNDHDPIYMLRLFVYLTEGVNRETGALRFHPIPVTKKIMRRGYLRRRAVLPPARRILNDEGRMLFFEGGPGSTCLLNPQMCLHRAGVPREGSFRDMVQFTLSPSNVPLASDWADRMPPDPDALR